MLAKVHRPVVLHNSAKESAALQPASLLSREVLDHMVKLTVSGRVLVGTN